MPSLFIATEISALFLNNAMQVETMISLVVDASLQKFASIFLFQFAQIPIVVLYKLDTHSAKQEWPTCLSQTSSVIVCYFKYLTYLLLKKTGPLDAASLGQVGSRPAAALHQESEEGATVLILLL